jgi:hypothetical protein
MVTTHILNVQVGEFLQTYTCVAATQAQAQALSATHRAILSPLVSGYRVTKIHLSPLNTNTQNKSVEYK